MIILQTNGVQIVQKYIHLWLKKVKKHKEIDERNDKGTQNSTY